MRDAGINVTHAKHSAGIFFYIYMEYVDNTSASTSSYKALSKGTSDVIGLRGAENQ